MQQLINRLLYGSDAVVFLPAPRVKVCEGCQHGVHELVGERRECGCPCHGGSHAKD